MPLPAVPAPQPAATRPAPAPLPAPPPKPADIFATLGESWQLPALISSATEAMGSLAGPPQEPLTLTLRSHAANLPPEAAIYADSASDPDAWSVLYVANLQSPDSQLPLATIRREGAQLGFAWVSAEGNAELRRQVANCQLELRHGQSLRRVQLRPPLEQPACSLDLNEDVQKLEFQLSDLPRPDLVRLKIAGLDGFPGSPRAKSDSLAIGQETIIEFSEPSGAQIEVRFRQMPAGQLAVQLEPVFKENGARSFDMTLPRLAAMEEGVTKALRSAERDLPVKRSELKAQQAFLEKLQDSPPKNALLLPAWRGEVNSQQRKIKSTAARIGTLQKQIATNKARLAAVPTIRSFLTALDQQAAIGLAIVAECGEGEIVLVRAMGKPQR